jgi:hypothetical protein
MVIIIYITYVTSTFEDNDSNKLKSKYDFLLLSLKANKSLTKLCPFSISCSKAWISLFQGILANESIDELVLGKVQLDGLYFDLPFHVCEEFAKLLSQTKKLKRLTLQGLSINNLRAVAAMATGLRCNQSIETLELHQFKPFSFVLFLGAITETNVVSLFLIVKSIWMKAFKMIEEKCFRIQ